MNTKNGNGLRKKLNLSSFDTFDPDNFRDVLNYDPDNMSGDSGEAGTDVRIARPGQKLQVNLTLSNPTAQNLPFEIWYAFNSCTLVRNPNYDTATYDYIPMLSFEGLQAGQVGVVGFGSLGQLMIRAALVDPVGTIQCGEYPYASFFEMSKSRPFFVPYFRFTCNTDAQIDNPIKHIEKTMGGGIKENIISPRAYFDPNQFQNRTIDITAGFAVDGNKGILLTVNAGESVRLSLFVQKWTKGSI